MLWNQATSTILQHWQVEIDHSLETGRVPLLQVGESINVLDVLPGVAALQGLLDQRLLVNRPQALIGGTSAGWLLALWLRRSLPALARSSGIRVVYSGADAATTIASAAITGGAESEQQPHWRSVRPLALAARIEPESQPAVPPGLDSLPVIVASREALAAENRLQDWVAWLAMALVLSVIALALIV